MNYVAFYTNPIRETCSFIYCEPDKRDAGEYRNDIGVFLFNVEVINTETSSEEGEEDKYISCEVNMEQFINLCLKCKFMPSGFYDLIMEHGKKFIPEKYPIFESISNKDI